jgi:glycosyltransferase involved in cell wall biosynthesis
VFYADEKFSFSKTWEHYTYQKKLKNAFKIICFDEATKDDLNERFNILEEKIEVIPPFFVFDDLVKTDDPMPLDVKARHNLSMDYMIYNAGYGVDKNLERLLEVFVRMREIDKNYALFVLGGEEVRTDLDIRKIVLDNNLNDRVFFHSTLRKEEEMYFFQQSRGVIYPVIYESFPFTLNKAIFYGCPIIASHISSVKNIFHEHVDYFNPVSKVDMTKSIVEFARKNSVPNYQGVSDQYSKTHFI